jgi:hypothetical protein
MLQITLDCVGTVAEVEQIAAKAAQAYSDFSYKVIEPYVDGNQWPTIIASSLDIGELLYFGSQVYGEPANELTYLVTQA